MMMMLMMLMMRGCNDDQHYVLEQDWYPNDYDHGDDIYTVPLFIHISRDLCLLSLCHNQTMWQNFLRNTCIGDYNFRKIARKTKDYHWTYLIMHFLKVLIESRASLTYSIVCAFCLSNDEHLYNCGSRSVFASYMYINSIYP